MRPHLLNHIRCFMAGMTEIMNVIAVRGVSWQVMLCRASRRRYFSGDSGAYAPARRYQALPMERARVSREW